MGAAAAARTATDGHRPCIRWREYLASRLGRDVAGVSGWIWEYACRSHAANSICRLPTPSHIGLELVDGGLNQLAYVVDGELGLDAFACCDVGDDDQHQDRSAAYEDVVETPVR